jgi:hypothetical protein
MKHFLQLIVFLFMVFHSLGQTQSLSGHWRRLEFEKKASSTSAMHQYGDLIIREDSTFTMIGDKAAQASKIPGWATGETYNGKWEINKKLLYFYIDYLRIPLVYKIKRQNKSELHLQSNFGGSHVMKYKRLD